MKLSCHICRRHSGSIRGIQMENNRSPNDPPEKFPLSDIDPSRTKDNVILVRSDQWMKDIKGKLAEHGIDGYRKNAVLLIDVVYSASADFFEINERDYVIDYFKDCLHFHETEFGNVINGVVHFDETTPHLHVVSVPLVEHEDGFALCARELIGNKSKLYAFHDHLFAEVGIHYDLERGDRSDSTSKRQHLDTYEYKLQSIQNKIAFAYNDLERLNIRIDKAGSVLELFSWVTEIAGKIDTVINALGGCTLEKIQEAIEARGVLLEKHITEAGCHIQMVNGTDRFCITDASDRPLSWNSRIPLYTQDGARLIPSWQILKNDHTQPWFKDDFSADSRDPAECSPVEKFEQIADELESLIENLDPRQNDVEQDLDDIDRWNEKND